MPMELGHIPVRNLRLFMQIAGEQPLEYTAIINELNELDHVCRYERQYADGHVWVTDK